jgi:DNA polymerase III subunit epsilon
MHFVFDVETTGLPIMRPKPERGFFPYRFLSKYNSARIVSISWVVLDQFFRERERKYYVVKPRGFVVPEESTRIHGITHEYADLNGVHFAEVMRDLKNTVADCDHIVAHNLAFDRNVLYSELYREHAYDTIKRIQQSRYYCTMLEGQKHMRVRKFPKLAELYKYIYNEDITGAHNALHDTLHCVKCYDYLVNRA